VFSQKAKGNIGIERKKERIQREKGVIIVISANEFTFSRRFVGKRSRTSRPPGKETPPAFINLKRKADERISHKMP